MLHTGDLGWGCQIMGLGLAAVFLMLLTLMAALKLLTYLDRKPDGTQAEPSAALAGSPAGSLAAVPEQTMDERTMPPAQLTDQTPQPTDPKVLSSQPLTDEEEELVNIAIAVHSARLDAERLGQAGSTDLDLAALAVAVHLAVTEDEASATTAALARVQSGTGRSSGWLLRGRSAQTTQWHRR